VGINPNWRKKQGGQVEKRNQKNATQKRLENGTDGRDQTPNVLGQFYGKKTWRKGAALKTSKP